METQKEKKKTTEIPQNPQQKPKKKKVLWEVDAKI
jgi:hypothetical protein